MLKDYYFASDVLSQFMSGPAGPYVDNFTQWLKMRGYAFITVRHYVRNAAKFMEWATQNDIAPETLSQTHLDVYRQFLESNDKLRSGQPGTYISYSAARGFVSFLQASGLATKKPSAKYDSPEIPLLREFREWILRHRGIADATCNNYSRIVFDLVRTLGDVPEKYTVQSLRNFVSDRIGGYGPGQADRVVTSVRSFIKFLIATNSCPSTFEHIIPSVAGWRLSRFPRYMIADDVEKVIKSCDPLTQTGARDYAILLLLARLGLRAGDVAALTFNDIDWMQGTFRVMGKGRREVQLPLPQDVGDAILYYIDKWRPKSGSHRVFLTTIAPFSPIASHVVSQIARRAILRARIKTPFHGAHVFRHSAATAMLRQGVPLEKIGRILRHESIETTTIYAKVDVGMLQQLVIPWPKVTKC